MVGQSLPSGCGKHMEQLLPPVVDLAVQGIAEGPANACMWSVLASSSSSLDVMARYSGWYYQQVCAALTYLMSTR